MRKGDAGFAPSTPTASSPGTDEARRAVAWAVERLGQRANSDRQQFDARRGSRPCRPAMAATPPDTPSAGDWPIWQGLVEAGRAASGGCRR